MPVTRLCLRLLTIVLAVSLGPGCAPQTTMDVRGEGLYRKIAVVAFLTDGVRGEWNDGSEKKTYGPTEADWDTRLISTEIVRDVLEGTGTQVVTITNPEDYLEEGDAEVGQHTWPGIVVRRLRDAGQIQDADAVLLLRQNAIDTSGREYSPGGNFWWGGFVGLIAGEVTKEERYFPSYLVAINVGFHETMVGRSRCMVGFDAHLFDTARQEVAARSFGLVGSYIVPQELWAPSFEEYSDAERQDLRARCQFALREALVDSMVRVGVARRK